MPVSRSTRAIAVSSIVLALIGLGASPGHAAGRDGGAATIVDPKTGQALRSGSSKTTWTFKLPRPPKSNCSGDSALKGFYVYGYLVSDSVAPASVTFNPDIGVDPRPGEVAFPLIDNFGKPYISRTTAPNTGQVMPGTGFNFARLSIDGTAGGELQPGTYNVGTACWDANKRRADRFWNATVTFIPSKTDPNGLVWRATPAAAKTDSSDRSPLAVALPVAGVAGAVAAAGLVIRRRARTAETNS